MERTQWKKTIKKACKDAGTYRPFFDSVIDTLAGIMETRDNAREKFEEYGGETIVTHTNKTGQVNTVKNPALVVLMDCDAVALQYWRDLGLTPSGYKKLNETVLKVEKKESALEKVLSGFA